MNAENFSQYLKNPSQLYQISYQELKSLVMQYPYSPNLRYLLMRKAKMDNHPDYEKLLALASTYSLDRKFLFQKMKTAKLLPELEENYELNEEYLELKDLASLSAEPELVENKSTEVDDELAFALDDLVEQRQSKPAFPSAAPVKEDNLTEEEPGSLLERLLDGDFTELSNAKEHEVMSSHVSLSEMSKVKQDKEENAVEEHIIENTLEELATKSEQLQQETSETIAEKDQEDIEIVVPESAKGIAKSKVADDLVEIDLAILLAKQEIEEAAFQTPVEEDVEIEEEGKIIEKERYSDLETVDQEEVAGDSTKSIQEDFAISLDELQTEDEKVEPAISSDWTIENKEEKPQEIRLSRPKPLPKSSFNSWLQQYRSPIMESRLEDFKEVTDKKKKKKKRKAKEKATLVMAKASIQEDTEIASETLASLLEKQGHYERAIKMYHTLRLRNPEKSGFFAAKIKTLQEVLDKE